MADALSNAWHDQRQAATLWTPTFTTGGSTFHYLQPPTNPAPTPAEPKHRLPFEWLDEQIKEITALAVP